MDFFKKPLIILALTLAALPMRGLAQYQFTVDPFFSYFRDAGRYEIGGNYILANGEYDGVARAIDGFGNFAGDTTLKRKITGTGVGGFIGISVPIKATGHISCWAAHFELQANQYSWTDLNKTYSNGNFTNVKPALNASTLQVALPIGIEWKIGCDAIESKRLNFATALGAGVIPAFSMTSLENTTGFNSMSSFGFTPYVKAEGTVFLGIAVKVRVMYTLGDVRMLEVDRAVPNGVTDGPFRIVSNSDLILSFIIMPFSGHWSESAWWNTHDTYNKHDRLN
jgi:hypothetical protein